MKTILLVDDEQEYLDLIVPRMKKWGYDIVSFIEGKKAIEYLQTEKPALMLLDLGLEDVSGMKLILDAKTKYPDLTIWVISAFNDLDLREQAGELKADDFIAKPFLAADLKAKLQKFFQDPSAG